MADAYNVARFNDQAVVLKRTGVHLGPAEVVILRTQIAAVSRQLGRITVATTDGRKYLVNRGLSGKQRAQVKQAFGL